MSPQAPAFTHREILTVFSGLIAGMLLAALCGVAQNLGQLIAFRGIQGIGGGGLMAMAVAIIGDVVSPRERGRYTGYLGAVGDREEPGGSVRQRDADGDQGVRAAGEDAHQQSHHLMDSECRPRWLGGCG